VAVRTVAFAVLFGIVGLYLEATGRGRVATATGRYVDYGAQLLFLSLLYLSSFVHVVPHELGHAGVGRLVRFKVLRIVVGVGSPVLERRAGSTSIEIRALPVGGATYGTTSARRALRTRLWLFAAGGPAATIVVTAMAWKLELVLGPSTWAGFVLWAFTMAGIVTAVTNLIPMRSRGRTSDGWKLVTTPFLSREKLDQTVAQSATIEAIEHSRRGDHDVAIAHAHAMVAEHPEAVGPRAALSVLLLQAERWAEAADEIRDQLTSLPLDEDQRASHLNNLAWADLMVGDPARLEEADHASAEAFQRKPFAEAIRGTRGSVLIERGVLAEGIQLVASSDLPSLTPRQKAYTHAYLAIGFARSGNVWEARKRCASARAADPTVPLLSRAVAEVGAAERQLAASTPGEPVL
jgi:hypothetical protein